MQSMERLLEQLLVRLLERHLSDYWNLRLLERPLE